MRTARTALASALPAAAAFVLVACAAVPSAPEDGACHAERVSPWVGKTATPEVRAEIARATDAKAIRWLYPDSVVTMDYSPARLNVHMDKSGVIRSAKCG